MNFRKKALALAILASSATFGSVAAYATTVTSQAETLPAVGHRPVAKVDGNTVIKATGVLTSGGSITITEFLYEDANKDALDVNATAGTLEWYLQEVNNPNQRTQIADSAGNMTVNIPANAGGKQLVAVYKLKTQTGNPIEAHQNTEVVFTRINAGSVTGGGSNGEIDMGAPIITAVNINLNSQPTDKINGTTVANTPIVGETVLTAEVVCEAGTLCADDNFDYQWLMDDGKGGAFSEIQNANAKTFTPSHDMQGRKFKVQATPKQGVGTRNKDQQLGAKKESSSKARR
ncbi:ZirU family protein [Escherichia coli]|uniref:ZirU family protein n=1 Tax=Escherichia coli TaxID=562 RepID=UPI0030F49C02